MFFSLIFVYNTTPLKPPYIRRSHILTYKYRGRQLGSNIRRWVYIFSPQDSRSLHRLMQSPSCALWPIWIWLVGMQMTKGERIFARPVPGADELCTSASCLLVSWIIDRTRGSRTPGSTFAAHVVVWNVSCKCVICLHYLREALRHCCTQE